MHTHVVVVGNLQPFDDELCADPVTLDRRVNRERPQIPVRFTRVRGEDLVLIRHAAGEGASVPAKGQNVPRCLSELFGQRWWKAARRHPERHAHYDAVQISGHDGSSHHTAWRKDRPMEILDRTFPIRCSGVDVGEKGIVTAGARRKRRSFSHATSIESLVRKADTDHV